MTTRRLFLENSGFSRPSGHYAFNRGGVTFVVLNGCYNAKGDVVVFTHQRLDPEADERHLMKNAAEVRGVLFTVRALGGNMQGWRKEPTNNPPRIEFRFHEYRNGKFADITK